MDEKGNKAARKEIAMIKVDGPINVPLMSSLWLRALPRELSTEQFRYAPLLPSRLLIATRCTVQLA